MSLIIIKNGGRWGKKIYISKFWTKFYIFKLRAEYQGLESPIPRTEIDFDPGI